MTKRKTFSFTPLDRDTIADLRAGTADEPHYPPGHNCRNRETSDGKWRCKCDKEGGGS